MCTNCFYMSCVFGRPWWCKSTVASVMASISPSQNVCQQVLWFLVLHARNLGSTWRKRTHCVLRGCLHGVDACFRTRADPWRSGADANRWCLATRICTDLHAWRRVSATGSGWVGMCPETRAAVIWMMRNWGGFTSKQPWHTEAGDIDTSTHCFSQQTGTLACSGNRRQMIQMIFHSLRDNHAFQMTQPTESMSKIW
jgi:hypothetical protein